MVERFENTVIVKLTDTQKQHLDLVTGSTGVTISEVVRMGIEILTPEVVREIKISELRKQAEEMAQGKRVDRAQLPLIRPKRKYRRKKRERASVGTTDSRASEDKVDSPTSPSPRK